MSGQIRIRTIQDIRNARTNNFTNADLEGADLMEADLEQFIFVGANFQGANLEGAYLTGSDLTGANLQGANLQDTFLRDTILENANLQNANLRMAFFDNTNLNGANLAGADVHDVLGIDQDELNTLINNNNTNNNVSIPTTPWIQDEDCVGQEDPVSMEPIAAGRGFRLEAENRCYDAVTLAEMRRLYRPLVGPMTRIPFTTNDITRVDQFRRDNPNARSTGGNKRKTHKKRKTRKTRKHKRANKKRKITRKNN